MLKRVKYLSSILLAILATANNLNCAMQEFPSLNDEFIRSCASGNLVQARELIAKGADINYKDHCSYTPLMIACSANKFDIVKLLLEYKADATLSDNLGFNALLLACFIQKLEIIRLLLENGADTSINAQGPYGWTALMHSATNNNINIVQLLLDYNADVLIKDNQGETVLDHYLLPEIRTLLQSYIVDTKPSTIIKNQD